MKKTTILAMSVVAATILFSCNKKENKEIVQNFKIEQDENGMLPIAYINIDTIISNYTFAIKADEKLIKKQEDARLNLNTKAKQLQGEMADFQRKLENNAFLSRERAEQEAQRLQKKESELQALEQKLTQDLMAEQQELTEKLRKDINSAIAEYNKDGRFHFILSTSTLQETVVYAHDAYNVTNDILKILNEKAETEK